MNNYSSAIITGSIAFDEIMDFPGKFIDHFHPERLHQINVSFVVDKLEKQLGGIATNISYNLSLVTKEKITLLSAVGKDGAPFLEFFKKNSINTKGVLVAHDLYTSTGKVITDIKDNQIWGFYYGALEQTDKLDLKKSADKNSLVIISATHLKGFMRVQSQAIQMKLDYVYDPGMALTWIDAKDIKEGVLHCKYLIANDYEIAQIEKKISLSVKDLIKKGIIVITTLGEKGVLYQDQKNTFTVPAYRLKTIVDPTGAGDAFRGGFVGGLLEGLSVEECLKQGNALASFAIEKYGTVNHKPTKKQIKDRAESI